MLSQQIYNLIQPFVAKKTIVDRSVDDIQNSIEDFITIFDEQTLVACCGIREHKNYAEVYCLAVNINHHNKGLSRQILQKVQQTTDKNIIALSKYQGSWFLAKGFVEKTILDLPKSINYNQHRKPRIFIYYADNQEH